MIKVKNTDSTDQTDQDDNAPGKDTGSTGGKDNDSSSDQTSDNHTGTGTGDTDTGVSDDTSGNTNENAKKVTKDGIIYELRDTYAYVTGAVEGTQNANIPSKVEGLPVTAIGKGFGQCPTLKTVTWSGDTITVEPRSFLYNTSITLITLKGGTVNIGLSAFDNCSSLKSVELSGVINSIGA
jgi:hypothetical protein